MSEMDLRSSGDEPRVFVVDDDASVLDSIRLLLESVGLRAQTFLSASDFLETFDPDVTGCLVLDVRMPGMSGVELQNVLRERHATLPIIFLTAHGDVPMAVDAVKKGALDFIQKPFRDQDLLDRVQEAFRIHAERRRREAVRYEAEKRLTSLTPRERDVLEGVVQGKSNKRIARDLGISPRTVEIHRAHVMEKGEVSSVPELVKLVLNARE